MLNVNQIVCMVLSFMSIVLNLIGFYAALYGTDKDVYTCNFSRHLLEFTFSDI